ncbi:MAG: hypothetical protein H6581_27240 [Bacteroidia bacterium]|nr:hypothetical protein [Bacteroidia bacterium]
MKTDLPEIQTTLIDLLKAQVPRLRIRMDGEKGFEVCGKKETMQGKQKVDGYYFATVVPKPGDVRFYFFPIYTHPQNYPSLSPELKKCLKGKSCFHIKKLDAAMEKEIGDMIQLGVDLYDKDGLI